MSQTQQIRKVVVASSNPVKLRATRGAFQRMFPGQEPALLPISAPSGVSEQPLSDEETLQGARNRARHAASLAPEADYWVGIEGGVEERGGQLAAFAWVVIRSRTGEGRSRTATFFLPPRVAHLVRQGKELGEADDIVFGHSNSKQKGGAVGLLTGNVIDRAQLYEQAVVLALVPFTNETLFAGQQEA